MKRSWWLKECFRYIPLQQRSTTTVPKQWCRVRCHRCYRRDFGSLNIEASVSGLNNAQNVLEANTTVQRRLRTTPAGTVLPPIRVLSCGKHEITTENLFQWCGDQPLPSQPFSSIGWLLDMGSGLQMPFINSLYPTSWLTAVMEQYNHKLVV